MPSCASTAAAATFVNGSSRQLPLSCCHRTIITPVATGQTLGQSYWSMCRLTATRVVVRCTACAAYGCRQFRQPLECMPVCTAGGRGGGDLALPERALLRSPLGSRTQVHSPRFSLAKPARRCDITAYKLYWSMCRLTATRVVVMCAACAAYERLTALFGVCGVGWSMCRLTATRVVVMCATCRWLMNA